MAACRIFRRPPTLAGAILSMVVAFPSPTWAAAPAPEGGPGCAGLQVEQEPNDTAASATPIVFGSNGLFVGIYGTIVSGDVDWFRFPAAAGARVWLSVDTGVAGPGGSRDSVVSIFAPDGVTLIETDDDDGTGNGRDFTVESLDASLIAGPVLPVAGTYYVRVQAKVPGQTIDGYSLLIGVTAFGPLPESEPNDCPPGGSGIPPLGPLILGSLSSATDVDCYNFTLLDGGFPLVVVDGDPERDGIATDVTLNYFSIGGSPTIVTDSSGSGGPANPPAEGFAMQWSGGVVRITGTGPGTYMLAGLYSGDLCQVPVELLGFRVE